MVKRINIIGRPDGPYIVFGDIAVDEMAIESVMPTNQNGRDCYLLTLCDGGEYWLTEDDAIADAEAYLDEDFEPAEAEPEADSVAIGNAVDFAVETKAMLADAMQVTAVARMKDRLDDDEVETILNAVTSASVIIDSVITIYQEEMEKADAEPK